jgi:hypothetical protein
MSVVIICVETQSADVEVAAAGCAVHRAVDPAAPFRYITVGDTVPTVAGAARLLSGVYDVIHVGDAAAPAFDATAAPDPLVFINCFEMPVGGENAAFALWRTVNEYMVNKPGYPWHRLHRRRSADAPFGLVNVVGWKSIPAWEAAHDDGFRALAARPNLPFLSRPTLCRLVSDGRVAVEA